MEFRSYYLKSLCGVCSRLLTIPFHNKKARFFIAVNITIISYFHGFRNLVMISIHRSKKDTSNTLYSKTQLNKSLPMVQKYSLRYHPTRHQVKLSRPNVCTSQSNVSATVQALLPFERRTMIPSTH